MSKVPPTIELPTPLPANPEAGQWRSMVFSFVFHLIIFLVIFGVTYSTGGGGDSVEPDRSGGIVLTVQSKPTAEKEYLDEEKFEASEALSESASTNASSQSSQDTAPEIDSGPSPTDIDLPGFQFNSNDDASQMTAPTTNGFKPSYELSDAARDIMAADRARFDASKPSGPATSLSVFGTGQIEGRSFLFLLDRSDSMGSSGLGLVQSARKELSAAIEKLDSHHKFQILGYNNKTVYMKAPRLLSASRENKLEVEKYISHMAANGPTNHMTGIMSAISYRPDVIVMLTDGGFPGLDEDQLKRIRTAARGQTQIHCVQFGLGPQRLTDEFMGLLAAQNGGTFRYEDVNEWRK